VDNEKEHIMSALKIANGKVTGENSAAQLLGINGKTLGSKMRKLNIKRQFVITADKN
jgi:transcriptional regulator with GAF, ATPase, and Fis domain